MAATSTLARPKAKPIAWKRPERLPATGIADLFDATRMPAKPRCTNNVEFGTRVLPLQLAQGFRYIQPNRPNTVTYLVFDIDRAGGADAWRDAGLPPPNVTVTTLDHSHGKDVKSFNRQGRAHLFYVLEDPVYSGSEAVQGPSNYVEAIRTAFTRALGADEGFTGDLAKNPLHQHWLPELLHTKTYSLHELAEYVVLKGVNRGAQRVVGLGRNCTLFDDVRKWAYRQKLSFQTQGFGFESFKQAVEAEAQARNRFDGQESLPWKEVQHTAKSIATWTWRWYTGCGVATPEFKASQALRGAMKGAKTREQGMALLQAGATVDDLVDQMQVARSTAYEWRRKLREAAQEHQAEQLQSEQPGQLSGSHQVAAGGDSPAAAAPATPSLESNADRFEIAAHPVVDVPASPAVGCLSSEKKFKKWGKPRSGASGP